jgi:cilia- and flagella-associated protein 57
VDESLADIVLVRKQEMEEWRRKQEQLHYELNVNKRKVELKLRETKQKYERQYHEIEKQKDLDIKDLEKRYEDLRRQKELQDHQNQQAMHKMEENHIAAVEDLEAVYERKLNIECGNYLKLE